MPTQRWTYEEGVPDGIPTDSPHDDEPAADLTTEQLIAEYGSYDQ